MLIALIISIVINIVLSIWLIVEKRDNNNNKQQIRCIKFADKTLGGIYGNH